MPQHTKRRQRGVLDTPVDMARRVVSASKVAVDGECRTGLDMACGAGAFLVAMHEAGVPEVFGADTDPLSLRVAAIACPSARLEQRDALSHGDTVDLVVGNPPFVPPEQQDRYLRARLRQRFPWLQGRFDLAVPFAAVAADRVRSGGAAGLVLPHSLLVQSYGATLRRRWVERHEVVDLSGPHPFPGASVDVMLVVLRAGAGPAPLPLFAMPAEELLRLDSVPLNPDLMPGDVELVEKIRGASFRLDAFCMVDTGIVMQGPRGGKSRLLYDKPRKGRVPFAEAKDFFAGRLRWLKYVPEELHRAKQPEMFENPKIVIQRNRGRAPVRAAIDWDGVYVGNSCTLVWPQRRVIPLDRVLDLVRSPLVDAVSRIERGQRTDLYPRDVSSFPVPKAWLTKPHLSLAEAYGLTPEERERLEAIATR